MDLRALFNPHFPRGNFDRIALFIYTHSDKDRGDLFYCGDESGEGSASTNIGNVSVCPPCPRFPLRLIQIKFFEAIVGQDLKDYIPELEYSLMILAACGSVVTAPGALEGLREVIEKCVCPASNFTSLTD